MASEIHNEVSKDFGIATKPIAATKQTPVPSSKTLTGTPVSKLNAKVPAKQPAKPTSKQPASIANPATVITTSTTTATTTIPKTNDKTPTSAPSSQSKPPNHAKTPVATKTITVPAKTGALPTVPSKSSAVTTENAKKPLPPSNKEIPKSQPVTIAKKPAVSTAQSKDKKEIPTKPSETPKKVASVQPKKVSASQPPLTTPVTNVTNIATTTTTTTPVITTDTPVQATVQGPVVETNVSSKKRSLETTKERSKKKVSFNKKTDPDDEEVLASDSQAKVDGNASKRKATVIKYADDQADLAIGESDEEDEGPVEQENPNVRSMTVMLDGKLAQSVNVGKDVMTKKQRRIHFVFFLRRLILELFIPDVDLFVKDMENMYEDEEVLAKYV